jgi:hypothetical protein
VYAHARECIDEPRAEGVGLVDQARDDFDAACAALEHLAEEVGGERDIPEFAKHAGALPFVRAEPSAAVEDENTGTRALIHPFGFDEKAREGASSGRVFDRLFVHGAYPSDGKSAYLTIINFIKISIHARPRAFHGSSGGARQMKRCKASFVAEVVHLDDAAAAEPHDVHGVKRAPDIEGERRLPAGAASSPKRAIRLRRPETKFPPIPLPTYVAPSKDNTPCDPNQSSYCLYPAQCVGGVCTLDAATCH